MMDVSENLSNKIANMGFVCACLVILIHCPHNTKNEGVRFMYFYFPGAFTSIANAFFFIVSGFFLAAHLEEKGWWKREISKRVHSLLIPYVVLNVIWFGVMAAYQWPNVRYPVDADSFHWVDILRAFGIYGKDNPVMGPLWYVRTLMFFVLTLPVFVPIIKHWRYLLILCAILFAMNCLDIWKTLLPETLFWMYRPQWLAFFLGGIALRLHGFKPLTVYWGWILIIIGFLLSCYAHPDKADNEMIPLYNLFRWLNRPILIVGLFTVIPNVKWPKCLTGNTFAIYSLHWPLIMAAYIISGRTGMFKVLFGNVFFCFMFMACVIVLTIAVGEILRYSKILNRIILGGR